MADTAIQNPATVFIEDIPDNRALLSTITGEYKNIPGGLIPALQRAQDKFGYLPQWSLEQISIEMNQPLSLVAGVVSFYSYFSTKPKGRHTVRVCLGTACYVRGGNQVMKAVAEYLGIECGETTEDGLFSLDSGRCFGACGLAPVMMVDDEVIQRVKPTKIKEILDSFGTQDHPQSQIQDQSQDQSQAQDQSQDQSQAQDHPQSQIQGQETKGGRV